MSALTDPPHRTSTRTHPGAVRPTNEDALLDRGAEGLWLVADGAGGHGGGAEASRAVVEALAALPLPEGREEAVGVLRGALEAAHRRLAARSAAEGRARPMASTVVLLLVRGDEARVLWAGDSRAYLLRGGALERLTRDHSEVAELVASGALSEAEAERHPRAHVVTRALGAGPALRLDEASRGLRPGDALLLCTDGLTRALGEAEIGARLSAGEGAEGLVGAALAAGARDNATAVVVRLNPPAPPSLPSRPG